MQETLVIIIVCAAVAYACKCAYRTIKQAGNPCYGCAGCALKDIKTRQEKRKCVEKQKKGVKKFWRYTKM